MKKVLLLALVLCIALYVPAQHGNIQADTRSSFPAQIDAYLQSAVRANKFNGVALVARGGKVVFHKAYGWSNASTRTPNDTSTRFPILSITKAFTAMVLLRLQEAAKLSLKDSLGKYLPGFPKGTDIQVGHLLNHSSGLFNYTDLIDEEDSAIVCHPVTKERVVELFRNQPLAFQPGKGFSYNNSAYFLAGLIIEQVTGKPYEQVVREMIFEPLGMQRSGFDYLGLPAAAKAVGYQFLDERQQKVYPFLDSTVSYSAGAIYSTTSDMLKWTQAIARRTLLADSSWNIALTPSVNDYGYGFRSGAFKQKRFIRHDGGYPGYASEFVYFPDDDITIILFKNVGTYGQGLYPIAAGLSSIMLGQPYDLWQRRTEVQLPDAALTSKAGRYGSQDVAMTFQVKDGRLRCIMPGGELDALAENDTDFFFADFNTRFHFVQDATGKTVQVVIRENGQDLTLNRIN